MRKSKDNLGGGENEEESCGGSRSDMAPETVDGVHNEVKGALPRRDGEGGKPEGGHNGAKAGGGGTIQSTLFHTLSSRQANCTPESEPKMGKVTVAVQGAEELQGRWERGEGGRQGGNSKPVRGRNQRFIKKS